MTFADFFKSCNSVGLVSNKDIATAFVVSIQTVKNWRSHTTNGNGSLPVPGWIPHAVTFVNWCHQNDRSLELESKEQASDFPVMSVGEFKDWQYQHGLKTYQQTADVFSVKRQAVHNWFCRGHFPLWIPRACLGYSLQQEILVNAQ